jgi:hypothetical protein
VRLYSRNGNDFTKRCPARGGSGRDAAGAILPDRRRGHRQQRVRARGVRIDPVLTHDPFHSSPRLRPVRARRRGLAPAADRGAQGRARRAAAQAVARHPAKHALRRRRRFRLPAGLQARLRGDRVEAARLGVPRPIETMA